MIQVNTLLLLQWHNSGNILQLYDIFSLTLRESESKGRLWLNFWTCQIDESWTWKKYNTWLKWGFLCVCATDIASTSAILRTWYEKSNSSKCSCCPSKYIMVHPPQATESPSTSRLLDGAWSDSSRYPCYLRTKTYEQHNTWLKIICVYIYFLIDKKLKDEHRTNENI